MNKIILITPGFPKDESDISCLPYLQDYILHLRDKAGAENIMIVATQYPYTKIPYSWNGIRVFPAGGKNKKFTGKYFTMRRSHKIIAALQRRGNSVLHAFWLGECAWLAHRASEKNAAPYIVNLMGQDALRGKRLLDKIKNDGARIVAISENQGRAFYQAHHKKVDAVIPLPLYHIPPPDNSIPRDIDVLFNGSFIKVKEPYTFVDVIDRVRRAFPAMRVVMTGDGPLLSKTAAYILDKDLGHVISCTGNISRNEVFNYMRRAKILLHTSVYEGQCHSFAEAMAHGMYVVSRNVGRIEASPKHLVAESPEEMEDKLRTLLQSALDFAPVNTLDGPAVINDYIRLYAEASR